MVDRRAPGRSRNGLAGRRADLRGLGAGRPRHGGPGAQPVPGRGLVWGDRRSVPRVGHRPASPPGGRRPVPDLARPSIPRLRQRRAPPDPLVHGRRGRGLRGVHPAGVRACTPARTDRLDSLAVAVFFLALCLPPLAILIAISRYRLYEIDHIINRAVLYGSLTAVLAGLFTAAVALSQRLFVALTGEGSDAAIGGSSPRWSSQPLTRLSASGSSEPSTVASSGRPTTSAPTGTSWAAPSTLVIQSVRWGVCSTRVRGSSTPHGPRPN